MSVILIVPALKPVTKNISNSISCTSINNCKCCYSSTPPVASVTFIVKLLSPPPVVVFTPVVPLVPALATSAASPGPLVVIKVLLPLSKNPLL